MSRSYVRLKRFTFEDIDKHATVGPFTYIVGHVTHSGTVQWTLVNNVSESSTNDWTRPDDADYLMLYTLFHPEES